MARVESDSTGENDESPSASESAVSEAHSQAEDSDVSPTYTYLWRPICVAQSPRCDTDTDTDTFNPITVAVSISRCFRFRSFATIYSYFRRTLSVFIEIPHLARDTFSSVCTIAGVPIFLRLNGFTVHFSSRVRVSYVRIYHVQLLLHLKAVNLFLQIITSLNFYL